MFTALIDGCVATISSDMLAKIQERWTPPQILVRVAMIWALLAGVAIADGWTRLAFVALLGVFAWSLIDEYRGRRPRAPDPPAGPIIVAFVAWIVAAVILWAILRPADKLGTDAQVAYAACSGLALAIAFGVKGLVARLPRYRAVPDIPPREPDRT
jgi:hypothetical protein